jgi:hypothetical protein
MVLDAGRIHGTGLGSARLPSRVAGDQSRRYPAGRKMPIAHPEDRRKDSRCLRWPPARTGFRRALSVWPCWITGGPICMDQALRNPWSEGKRSARHTVCLTNIAEREKHPPERPAGPCARGMRWLSARGSLRRLQGLISPGGCYGPTAGRRPLCRLCLVLHQEPHGAGEGCPVCQRRLAGFPPPGARGPGATPDKDRRPGPAQAPAPVRKRGRNARAKAGGGRCQGGITPWAPHTGGGGRTLAADTGRSRAPCEGCPPARPPGRGGTSGASGLLIPNRRVGARRPGHVPHR